MSTFWQTLESFTTRMHHCIEGSAAGHILRAWLIGRIGPLRQNV